MLVVSRMLSLKIPAAIMTKDRTDQSVELVILEPPEPAPTLILGSRILRERVST